jgi:multidrug efflux system outer membrane protein
MAPPPSHRLATLLVALGLTGGCVVGPNYHRPSADVRPTWAATDAPAASAIDPGTGAGLATSRPSVVHTGGTLPDQWWMTLNDPTLDALVDRAARSNLGLRAAAARVRAARARTAGATAGLFPTARALGEQNFNRAGGPLFPVEQGDYQFGALGFDASWELDLFGGTRRAIEEARDDQQAAVEGRRDALVSLVAEVCREYIALRTAQRRAAIAIDDLRIARQLLDLTRRGRAVGMTGDLDVVRAQAQVTNTAAALPALDAQAQQLIHGLGVLLGEPPDTLLADLSRPGPVPQTPAQVPVGLPASLLRRRPDVRQAERELAAATASIGVAEANLYPQVSLTGDLGVGATSPSDLFNWSSRFVGIGPQARWLLFDAGRVLADVDSRRAIREQVLAEYQQAILSAVRDVEDAVVAFDREQDRRELYRQTVDANAEAVRIANEQYADGVTGFLTVLDAQRSLFASQDALAQSDGAVAIDLVALYKGLGGGWESAERLGPKVRSGPKGIMPAAQVVER